MSSAIDIDLSEYKEFFALVQKAGQGDFKRELGQFLEGLGNEFLRVLEDEIIRRETMDTRLLLNSFHRGNEGNVWEISDGGLTLEVGTSVKYAQWVNDGHTQQPGRFIPGHWEGDRFVYEPGAKTGMVLKANWVKGTHYWDSALRIINEMYPELLDAKLQQWMDDYFGM